MVNSGPQTQQWQPLTKPETPLQNTIVENVNTILLCYIAASSFRYSQRRSEGRNIIEKCAIAPTSSSLYQLWSHLISSLICIFFASWLWRHLQASLINRITITPAHCKVYHYKMHLFKGHHVNCIYWKFAHRGRVPHICVGKLSLVQIMVCRIWGTSPLHVLVIAHC